MDALVIHPDFPQRPPHQPWCALYLDFRISAVYALRIRGTHYIKLGAADIPLDRVRPIQRQLARVGASGDLLCTQRVFAFKYVYERALRYHFRAYRVLREWFCLPPIQVRQAFEVSQLQALYHQAVAEGFRPTIAPIMGCTCKSPPNAKRFVGLWDGDERPRQWR